MSARNLITVIPAPGPKGGGYVSTRGTKVLAGDDVEIHGIKRIELVAEVDGVWQVRLEAFGGELPPALVAQLADERMLVEDFSYPVITWKGRMYNREELSRFAAAHASACMQRHRDRVKANADMRWKISAVFGWAVAAGCWLGTVVYWMT